MSKDQDALLLALLLTFIPLILATIALGWWLSKSKKNGHSALPVYKKQNNYGLHLSIEDDKERRRSPSPRPYPVPYPWVPARPSPFICPPCPDPYIPRPYPNPWVPPSPDNIHLDVRIDDVNNRIRGSSNGSSIIGAPYHPVRGGDMAPRVVNADDSSSSGRNRSSIDTTWLRGPNLGPPPYDYSPNIARPHPVYLSGMDGEGKRRGRSPRSPRRHRPAGPGYYATRSPRSGLALSELG